MNKLQKICGVLFFAQSICYAENVDLKLSPKDAEIIYFLIKDSTDEKKKDKYHYVMDRYGLVELVFNKYKDSDNTLDLRSWKDINKYLMKLINANEDYFKSMEKSEGKVDTDKKLDEIKSKFQIKDEINIGKSSYRQVEEFLIAFSIMNLYNRVYKNRFLSRVEQENLSKNLLKYFDSLKFETDGVRQLINNKNKIEDVDIRFNYGDYARSIEITVESLISDNGITSGEQFLKTCVEIFDLKNLNLEDLKKLLNEEEQKVKNPDEVKK